MLFWHTKQSGVKDRRGGRKHPKALWDGCMWVFAVPPRRGWRQKGQHIPRTRILPETSTTVSHNSASRHRAARRARVIGPGARHGRARGGGDGWRALLVERVAVVPPGGHTDGRAARLPLHAAEADPGAAGAAVRAGRVQGVVLVGAEPVLPDRFQRQDVGVPLLLPAQPLPAALQ